MLPPSCVHTRCGPTVQLQCQLVVAVLAAAAYLPCDPGYPDDRLAIYLEDGGASVLLVQPQHRRRAETLAGAGCPVLDVAEAQLAHPRQATATTTEPLAAGSAVAVSAQDPAYIIFTSGSTGRPKGVVVSQEALRDYAAFLGDRFQLKADDVSILSIPSKPWVAVRSCHLGGLSWAWSMTVCRSATGCPGACAGLASCLLPLRDTEPSRQLATSLYVSAALQLTSTPM